jgi:hypothetical protein
MAVIEQVPTPTRITRLVTVLQTEDVVEAMVTGSRELACAVNAKGGPPKI